MRVRMLNPTSADLEMINRDTVPVRIDITEDGFPDHPVLRWHKQALEDNPWIRRRFGHFVVVDPINEEVRGTAFGPHLDMHLRRLVHEYHTTYERAEPLPLDAPMPDYLNISVLNWEWMTAYELAFDTWLESVELLVNGEQLAPGVRNLAVHTIGDLLSSNLDATYQNDCKALGIIVQERAGFDVRKKKDTLHPELGDDLPNRRLDVYERAAAALVMALDLPYELDDPDLVEKVKGWWAEHKHDEDLVVEFSDDPKLRYSFLNS